MTSLKDLRYGTEIEFVGISRETAALTIAAVLGTIDVSAKVEPYSYAVRSFHITATDGRVWNVVADGSVHDTDGTSGGEMVTPILTWADMPVLQAIVRALRAAGARANATCGQHVHVDGAAFKTQPGKLINLVNLQARREGMVRTALAIAAHRTEQYCKPFDIDTLTRIRRAGSSLRGLNKAWFGQYVADPAGRFGKYHDSRYHALNLYSFFYRGTVEFRHFNGTVHAGEVRANICLALGMVARSLNVRNVSQEAVTAPATKADMTAFCKRLGLVGAEFQNVRVHLSKPLEGKAPEAFLDDATTAAVAA